MTSPARRDLVAGAAVSAAALAAPRLLRAQGANDRIQVGVIGCGGMANVHVDHYLQRSDVEIVAVADVDPGPLEHTAVKVEKKTGRKPTTYRDYRELLTRKDIQAVSIGTPDHWHAICMIHACQSGMDVYCEKPISHNVVEGRAMVDAALRYGRVVQIGTQMRDSPNLVKAIELVKSGVLGRIVETQTWTTSNVEGIGSRPDGDPPPGVDYDMWLGPAPKRPFNPLRFHFTWRWFWDYGGGFATDLNVHIQDIVHLAMDAWSPTSVAAAGQIAHAGDLRDNPDTMVATYEFETPQGPFAHTYTVRRTSEFPPCGHPGHGDRGILFCGRKGTLFADYGGWELLPERKQGGIEIEPERTAPKRGGGGSTDIAVHIANFIECTRSRKKTTSDIESMHKTTTACHLANIAYRVGRRIYWDGKREKCFRDRDRRVPDEEANALLGREYRKPWVLPA